MTEYRKHKSGREFARVEGNDAVRVRCMSYRVEIIRDNSSTLAQGITVDKELYKPCTEQEFKEAFSEAMERIQTLKIS